MGSEDVAGTVSPLPVRDGVAPSYMWVQDAAPGMALAYLLARFADVTETTWRSRMQRAEVVDGTGVVLQPESLLRRGQRIWYYREIEDEPRIPFEEKILFRDEHLLVVDKPHFVPTTPGGRFLHESLLVRLKHALGEEQLVPIHRLDRETAGVVLFSLRAESRGAYQSMFQQRQVVKTYEAIAAPMPGRRFPFVYRSRLVEGSPFFRMEEADGEVNAETLVDVIEQRGELLLYRLQPHTGRKHQLRVHMAALGAPILNDAFYPEALPEKADDFSRPLKLLARAIAFDDPRSGKARQFESARTL